jgi:hypothetical protein
VVGLKAGDSQRASLSGLALSATVKDAKGQSGTLRAVIV